MKHTVFIVGILIVLLSVSISFASKAHLTEAAIDLAIEQKIKDFFGQDNCGSKNLEKILYVPNQLIIETNSQAKDLLVSAGLPKGYPPDLLNPVASSPLYILNSPDDVQSFLSENEP